MNRELTVSLEEFGLSSYEARAYVTLISKGTISVSELAYYADIPRTKTYHTLGRLEKKGLVLLSKGKPITCSATSPEDAFDDIIQEQISRVNSMNTLVSDFKKIYENNRKVKSSKDTMYMQLDSSGILEQLIKMIDGSTSSIDIMVDSLGLSLIANCKKQFLLAAKRKIPIKILVKPKHIEMKEFTLLPAQANVRLSKVTQNCFVFDQGQLLIINEDNGKGAMFPSTDTLVTVMYSLFQSLWNDALDTKALSDMSGKRAKEIYEIINLIQEQGFQHSLNSEGRNILELLEKHGINLKTKTLEEMVEISDIILDMTCSGNVSYDQNSQNIIIDSMRNNGSSLPWAHMMQEFLHQKKCTTKFIRKNTTDGEKVNIKILKSNSHTKQ